MSECIKIIHLRDVQILIVICCLKCVCFPLYLLQNIEKQFYFVYQIPTDANKAEGAELPHTSLEIDKSSNPVPGQENQGCALPSNVVQNACSF